MAEWYESYPAVEPVNSEPAQKAWYEHYPAVEEAPQSTQATQQAAKPGPLQGGLQKTAPNIPLDEAVLSGAEDMLLFGHKDEAFAALDAVANPLFGTGKDGDSFSERYRANREDQRDILKAAQDQHPIAFGVGGIAGALGPALATGGASVAGAVAKQGLGKAIAKGAATGAAYGGAYGFGSGEGDLSDQAIEAGKGALIGGAAGAAIPLLVSGASKLKETASGLLPGNQQKALTGGAEAVEGSAVPLTPAASPQADNDLLASVRAASRASPKKADSAIDNVVDQIQPDQEILASAERLGVRDKLLPSQYSQNQSYRELEQGLSSIPTSRLNTQLRDATSEVAKRADDLITEFGGSLDKAAVSDRFRTQAFSTIEDLEKRSDALYEEMRRQIPPTTPVQAGGTVDYLRGKAAELGDASFLSPIERRTLNALSGDTPATYARLDLIRKQVGEGLRGKGPFKDAESGSLRQLYGALSDDQGLAATAAGVGDVFTAAKGLVAQRKRLEDDLTSVIGKDFTGAISAKADAAIRQLGGGNFQAFDRLMERVPEDVRQEIAVTALNEAFTKGARSQNQLSVPGFVEWYDSLSRNGQAKARLEKYLPSDASARLKDLYTVARGMHEASRDKISTGRTQSLMSTFSEEGGAMSKIYGLGKQVAVAEGLSSSIGFPGIGTALVFMGNRSKPAITEAADKLLSSEQFRRALNAYVANGGTEAKGVSLTRRVLERSKPYREWLKELPAADRVVVQNAGLINWLSEPGTSQQGVGNGAGEDKR